MLTVSMAAQQIISERYLEEKEASESTEEVSNSDGSEERRESSDERSEPSETENQESEESEQDEEDRELDPAEQVFELHEDRWYVPNSNRAEYAVRKANGEIQYYKTKKGAAARLAEEYGADGIDVDMTAIQGGNYGDDSQF